MMKLNNKGMTIIEILVCFILVMTISASLYTTISMYNNKKHEEDVKQAIYKYKMLLTKEIYDDITDKRVTNVKVESSKTKITFSFNSEPDKILEFHENYISYDGMKYPLPKTREKNQLKFDLTPANITANSNVDSKRLFQIKVNIKSDTFGSKYNIKINGPTNFDQYYND